ncbi:spore germination protein [Psychrobacillus psychrodurans]|uniref:GerAB/ArcD/ProY family transporter n=1 Tax=Psychrobacillus psychrodurans TaxID=126157 RepID=UPI001F4ED210|nr:GerAB/ArcD/ProY family transporter [Psychrobacillus psychrodurans]MCK1996882.1 spore germination protein [Psychrobacillus psychrodurans]
MSPKNLKVLGVYHVIFLVQNTMVGTGLLSAPQRLSVLGYSQVLMPIYFGIIATITLWPMVWICSQYKGDNLFRINELLLGKWMGKGINVLIVLHFTLLIAAIISNYMNLIQSTALPEQTTTVTILLVLLLLTYIVNGGIKTIARFCTLAFCLAMPMVYFLRWGIEKGDLSHIFPLFNFTSQEFFKAMQQGYLSILGYELIMFYFPYIIDQKKAFKHAVIGICITISLVFITTLVSVMYYSEWQLEHVEFSVLHLFKAGEFSFVERIDIMGITFWVSLILTTAAAYLWSARKGLDSIRSKKNKYHVYFIAAAIFGVIMLPVNREFQQKLFDASIYIEYIVILWPIFYA